MTDDSIKNEIRQMRCAVKETKNFGGEWLSTNEWIEAVSDVEMFSEQLQQVITNPCRWKWAIISLHSGIQGMMVLALKGSNGLNVLHKKDAKRWLNWFEGDRSDESRPRNLKLACFLDLYQRIKGKWMLMSMNSQKFVPKGTQGRSIKDLNHLRNDFIHFTPKIWSHELERFPTIASDCLGIAEFLAWESGNVIWHEHDLKKRLGDAFKSARKFLCALRQKGLDGF